MHLVYDIILVYIIILYNIAVLCCYKEKYKYE